MKHLIRLFCCASLLAGLAGAPALAQTFRWVRTGIGQRAEARVTSLAQANGQVVATGVFTDMVSFGSQSFTTNNPYTRNAFTAQWGAATGAARWLQRSDGPIPAGRTSTVIEGTAAGLDAAGNSYVAYTLWHDARFGALTVAGSGDPNVSVAALVKYAPTGEVLWARRLAGSLRAEINALAVQPDGTCCLAGGFAGTLALGSQTLSSAGPADWNYTSGFVAKLTAAGEVQWARAQASTAQATPRGLALGPAGEVYVCGTFYGDVALSPTLALATRDDGSGGGGDGYLAKYDAAGAPQWAQQLGGTDGDQTNAVAVDASGNAFVVGTYGYDPRQRQQASITLGGITLYTSSYWNAPPYAPDGFVVKVTAQGQVAWVRGMHGGDEEPQAVAVNALGECYVSGLGYDGLQVGFDPADVLHTSANGYVGFVAKYGVAGNVRWLTSYSESRYEYRLGTALATDGAGHVFVGGAFEGASATFGAITVAGWSNTTSAFVAAIDDAQVLPTRPAQLAPSALQVYPNPGTGTVRLAWPAGCQPLSLEILDALGRSLHTEALSPTATERQFDLTGLAPGFYLVRLYLASQQPITQRLVIK